MSTTRVIGIIVLASLAVAISLDAAAARHHKRHRVVAAPHRFVYDTPEAARVAGTAGYIGAIFSTGILGPTTADPYDQPIRGYDENGRYRRGYVYPDIGPN